MPFVYEMLMKKSCWRVVLLVVMTTGGCGKKPVNAPAQLDKGYAQAEPAIRDEVQKAKSQLLNSNYTEALLTMDRIVAAQQQEGRALSPEQKQAINAVVVQSREAIIQNPKFNTPELYKAMSDLILRAHGEN